MGAGPAALMTHGGLGLSHDYLRTYFDQLAANNTVVYYDHPGNGRSVKPDDYSEMNFALLTSDAAALMAHLGHEKFTLIGHSYGGFIAQAFAAENSDLLNGLVLLNTVPAFDYQPTVSGTDEQMAAFGAMFSAPMADDTQWRNTWNLAVQMYFHGPDSDILADLDARTQYEHRAWNAAGALLATYNMLESLPKVKVDTLSIGGRHDGITPPEHGAERIASLMPNTSLAIFEDSGHYPFIEESDAFFSTLKQWLAR